MTFVMIGILRVKQHTVYVFQLHEVDVAVSDMLSPTETNCDVACLLYDVTNPRSFEFCARMYLVSIFFLLPHDIASWSDITSCNKIDKPLVVYRFFKVLKCSPL